MERYNADSKCPKCGVDSRLGDKYLNRNNSILPSGVTEVIMRTCKNCTYSFYQLPLDADKEQSKIEDSQKDQSIKLPNIQLF